jgi:hypothetical protein
MSPIQWSSSTKLNPHAYLEDILQRLPAYKVRLTSELLLHRWQPLTSIA